MKQYKLHSILLLILLIGTLSSTAQNGQNIRFVQCGSTHSLFVPENTDYSYEWSMTRGNAATPIIIPDTTNVTKPIVWDNCNTHYDISVIPVLDSVGCKGEPIYMRINTVDYLSLHALNDIFYVNKNDTLHADVSKNDFDDLHRYIIYNTDLIKSTKHGTISMDGWGLFTYTPDQGFVGQDSFIYEASNYSDPSNPTPIMTASALVVIKVVDSNQTSDLLVEKTGPLKALFNSQITYEILVVNNGPDIAKNVILNDTLPFGLFTPKYSIGNPKKDWNGSINLGDLASGDTIVLTLYADISPFSPKKIFNQALVYSDSYDPDMSNNDSVWFTDVSALYVDMPGQFLVAGCRPSEIPNLSGGNNKIVKYRWRPAIGLSDSTIANPVFTPVESTIGKSNPYVLFVTDNLGNVASDTINIIVSNIPVASILGDTILNSGEKVVYRNIEETITLDGSQSTGDRLSYLWWVNYANSKNYFAGGITNDSGRIDSLGIYHLTIRDNQECESTDSVLVMYESHPPVVVRDYIKIVAGTDTVVNALKNDYDRNGFKLNMTDIVTPPTHGIFSWDTLGNITYAPDLRAWTYTWDSIEYSVCNNGMPIKCNTGWMVFKIERPPLNADMVLSKSTPQFAFWDDTIRYSLLIYNNGPDTAKVVNLTDHLDANYLVAPTYRTSNDNGTKWSDWSRWKNQLSITDMIEPITNEGSNGYLVQIKAYIDPRAQKSGVVITNKAYIYPEKDFVENDRTNDTSIVSSTIRQKVIAVAGKDRYIGACQSTIELNGTKSSGENISFNWSPGNYFHDPQSSTPTFDPPNEATGIVDVVLTVTDNMGITDTDTIKINVLAEPLANAGPDKFLKTGQNIFLDGSGSKGSTRLKYLWTTDENGHFTTPAPVTGVKPGVDSIGMYYLQVTDSALCMSFDTVEVYQYYFPPVAIPDYYSTTPNTPIVTDGVVYRSVLYNDFDPNGYFEDKLVIVKETNKTTQKGGKVSINSDGSFTYTPKSDYSGVDYFSYKIWNTKPGGYSFGYVKISIGVNDDPSKIVNLSIDKKATYGSVLVGGDIEFILKITNNSTEDQGGVYITDTLSTLITDAYYSYDGYDYSSSNVWKGQSPPFTLLAGQSKFLYIKGKVVKTAYGRIYNSAMVTSESFDDQFDWDNVENRNVDTVSVMTENSLIARAELVEKYDKNKQDNTIGVCDNTSFLSAMKSSGTLGIDEYQWQPADFLTPGSDTTKTATFRGTASDTTIIFTLTVYSGEISRSAFVTVNFSPKVIADAGPDRKMNKGVPLTLDGSASHGADAVYTWWNGSTQITDFENGDPLKPIITSPDVYVIEANDKHGCNDKDTVFIRENQLYALNDILVIINGRSFTGNVANNDYDPNGDSIYYPGVIINGPMHGSLAKNPPGYDGVIGSSGNKISNNGTYIYNPIPGYVGLDYFTYEVCDNNNPDLCVTAKVFIKVVGVDTINSNPVANTENYFVNINDTLQGNLLENDYDFDGGSIHIDPNPMRKTGKGTLTINPDGTFIYIPDLDAEGADSFYYRITDNGKPPKSDSTMVSIIINKILEDNHKPVAIDDAYFVVEDSISGDLLLNDYDPDGNEISVDELMTVGPTHGDFFFNDQYGRFTYTPFPGYEGTDQMTYQIIESGTIEKFSSTATVYFTCFAEKRYHTDVEVTKTGPIEILSGDTIQYSITAKVNGPTLANDIVIRDTLSSEHIASSIEYSRNGGINWYPWKDTIRISRLWLYEEYSILIRGILIDTLSGELSNVARVSHDMTEMKPANNRSEWITRVLQKVIANAGNDTLIGSCIEKFQLDGTKSIGMNKLQYQWSPATNLDRSTTGRPTYSTTPATDQVFTLIVSCTYHGFTDSDTTNVKVSIAQSPEAVAPEAIYNAVGSVVLSGYASSGYGPLSYSWRLEDGNGKITLLDSTMDITVNRQGKYILTVIDSFGCKAEDHTYMYYKIEPIIAVNDYFETPQKDVAEINVLRNDIIDSDDEVTIITITSDPVHGRVEWNSNDSTFSYTPEPYYIGLDTFYYTIYGNLSNTSDEAMVVVNVLNRPAIVPEGFSPNGDGINDDLQIKNIEKYPLNSFIVFNRWGSVVYKKEKYSNDSPWNGVANKGVRIGSGTVPTGVYLFILDLGNDNIQQKIVKGNIYIASDKH